MGYQAFGGISVGEGIFGACFSLLLIIVLAILAADIICSDMSLCLYAGQENERNIVFFSSSSGAVSS